jgi:hypothetical protein
MSTSRSGFIVRAGRGVAGPIGKTSKPAAVIVPASEARQAKATS